MSKLWLITFSRDGLISSRPINVLLETRLKFKVPAEPPFDKYQYIHKHNLSRTHNYNGEYRYIVSSDEIGHYDDSINEWILDEVAV